MKKGKPNDVTLLAAALGSGDLERFLELKRRIVGDGKGFVIRADTRIHVEQVDLTLFPLERAVIHDTTFTECTFNGGSLEGADLTDCLFVRCTFRGTKVRKLATTNTSFEECVFEGMKFAQADFSGGVFYGPSRFTKCSFAKIKAKGIGWEDVVVDTERARRCLQRQIVRGVHLPRKRRSHS